MSRPGTRVPGDGPGSGLDVGPMQHARAASSILTEVAAPPQGGAPDWVMLFPAGPDIVANDGRRWRIEDAAAVVTATKAKAGSLHLPIDWEHAADHKAPKGEPAPAAGWIEDYEVRDGAIFGRVGWTNRGRASVAGRSYRYLSPSFMHDKSGRVAWIVGAGLVNRPAIDMPALASQQQEETDMDKALLAALGLPETATLEQATAAATKLTGDLSSAQAAADPTKFVPKADLDAALTRATAAEQKLAERDTAAVEAKAMALVEAAITAAKVAPASRDHYLALARKDYAAVETLLGSLPALAIADPSKTSTSPPKDSAAPLTVEEKAIAASLGLSETDFIKARAAA